MFDPQEGQDYIFDRYAYLGLEPDADESAIKAAIKQKRIENHPDNFVRAGEEIRQTAEATLVHVEDCATILLDAEKRPHYDERLAWFKENHPTLVSDSGVAIISLNSVRVDLDGLVKGIIPDQTAMKKRLALLAPDVSDAQLHLFRKMYQADPTDEDVLTTYREALERRLTVIGITEDLAWEAAGFYGHIDARNEQSIIASQYADLVEDEIQEAVEIAIPHAVNERALALMSGVGTPLALPAGPVAEEEIVERGSALTTLDDAAKDHIVAAAREAFESRTHAIKQLAEKKQNILQELLDLNPTYKLNTVEGAKETQVLMLREDETGEKKVIATLVASADDETNFSMDLISDYDGKTLEEIQALDFSKDTIAFELNPNVSYIVAQAFHSMMKHRGMLENQDIAQCAQR